MSDRRIREAYRRFIEDPEDIGAATNLVSLSLRMGFNVPEYEGDISKFFNDDYDLIRSYTEAMVNVGIGSPSDVAYYLESEIAFNPDVEWLASITERDTRGYPSHIAYKMLDEFHVSLEWVKTVVENATSGEPSEIANDLNASKSSTVCPIEWVKSVVENDKTGNSSYWAYRLYKQDKVSLEWTKSIIESAVSGDPCLYAIELSRTSDVNFDWVLDILRNAKVGDPSSAIMYLSRISEVSPKLVKSIIENDETGRPCFAAMNLFYNPGYSLEWAFSVVENAKTHDVPEEAYNIYENYKGKVSREWAESVIENSEAYPEEIMRNAYLMALNFDSSPIWVKEIIDSYKRSGDDNTIYDRVGYARKLANEFSEDFPELKEWVRKIEFEESWFGGL